MKTHPPRFYAIAIMRANPKLQAAAFSRVPDDLKKQVQTYLDDEILRRKVLKQMRSKSSQ